MRLSELFISFMLQWETTFKQSRTLDMSISRSLFHLINSGRNTVSQSIIVSGNQDYDWSKHYKFYSRSVWDYQDLFDVPISKTVNYFNSDYIAVSADDTKLRKTGHKIPGTQYYLDPLSPPFHPNLMWSQRVLHFSALLPLYNQYDASSLDETSLCNASRGIPVNFINAPAVKKPGKRATSEQWEDYFRAKKEFNLSNIYVGGVSDLRQRYDAMGASDKLLLMVVDGSFCNGKVFKSDIDRVNTIARCRKDASLCFRSTDQSRKFFSVDKFTPHSVYVNKDIPWSYAKGFMGKKYREYRYKEVNSAYWQRGAGKKPLRVIILSAIIYNKKHKGKRSYQDPAYILTDNHSIGTQELIQQYINRWEIEVNHRDVKTTLRVGQAQVWNENSVIRHPAHLVATYSILLLAALECYGDGRGEEYFKLPKWRKQPTRPSLNDILNTLKKELLNSTEILEKYGFRVDEETNKCVNF